MGGFRTWHGIQTDICMGCPPPNDTTYTISDTFAIIVVDTSKIVFPFTAYTNNIIDIFYFSSADTHNKSITLGAYFGLHFTYITGNIVYYYMVDSMVYTTAYGNPAEIITNNLYTP